MNMKKVTKYFKPIALSGMLLLSVGCTYDTDEETTKTTTDKSIQNIRGALQEQFNGPNEELEKLWAKMFKGSTEDYEKNHDRFYEYARDHVKSFYESARDEASLIREYQYLRAAEFNDYKLQVEKITIEDSETNTYDFTVDVTYTKDGKDNANTKEIRGFMSTNENGRIVSNTYHNGKELEYALHDKLETP